MKTLEIGKEKIFSIRRDRGARDRILGGVRGKRLRLKLGLRVRTVTAEPTAKIGKRENRNSDDAHSGEQQAPTAYFWYLCGRARRQRDRGTAGRRDSQICVRSGDRRGGTRNRRW